MLQRAASNAFSWWWASHIRTKQSKWLEQSLLDMEEKVHNALSIIQKDGDSFAKRAEMYYRHRPDLISFVEETFRAYRALAERYDKLSKSLQKANTTIASIFPDQISYDDFDDDDIGPPKRPKMPLQNQGPNAKNIPKVPEPPKNLKGLISNASKKIKITNAFKEDNPSTRVVIKSGLSEEEALEEIDKIQKDILAMQTMKEFIKSAYENGLSKYWEIENKINTMQQRVCRLQDEFKVGRVIEDSDARTVMAQAALKSCKNTLENLEEKRENSSQATRTEHKRIMDAKQKIMALKRKFLPNEVDESEKVEEQGKSQDDDKESGEKIRERLEEISKKPLTVSKLADTIDKLANKVISLESTVSSQTANIDNLRAQTNDLQTQIQDLEADKASLADGTQTLRKKIKDMEKKLHRVENLERDVEKQNSSLELYFTEARCNIEHLSEKLHDVQPDDEVEAGSPDTKEGSVKSDLEEEDVFEECSPLAEEANWESEEGVVKMSIKEGELKLEEVVEEKETPSTNNDGAIKNANNIKKKSETNDIDEVKNANTIKKKSKTNDIDEVKNAKTTNEKGETKNDDVKKGKPNRNEDIMAKNSDSRMENIKEAGNDESPKKPLKVYTTTLKNYKETKRKMSVEEKRRLETLFELTVLVRELKSGMMKKDSEIQILKQKLKQLQDELGKQNEENWQEDVQNDMKEEEDITINISIGEPKPVSEVEERLRMEIDAILDENLDFWLRFSSQFHQVQKFKTEVEDLKEEIVKVKAKGVDAKGVEAKPPAAGTEAKSRTSMFTTDLRSEIRPIYKHLKEIQGELTVWIEQAESLKEELHRRCASLTDIQEAITMALKEGIQEDEIKFSTHQAAKFQGEILNMEQENNRVDEELEAGLHHARSLHLEIKKTLRKLEDEFGLSDNQNPYQQNFVRTSSRPGIPLRSFIFGVKARKQRPSIFGTRNPKKVPTPRGNRP